MHISSWLLNVLPLLTRTVLCAVLVTQPGRQSGCRSSEATQEPEPCTSPTGRRVSVKPASARGAHAPSSGPVTQAPRPLTAQPALGSSPTQQYYNPLQFICGSYLCFKNHSFYWTNTVWAYIQASYGTNKTNALNYHFNMLFLML